MHVVYMNFVFYGLVFFCFVLFSSINQSHIPSILEDASWIMDPADIYIFIYIVSSYYLSIRDYD